MKAQIDVYRKRDPLNHQWAKYDVEQKTMDKYDVYFKNRQYDNDAYEEYVDLDTTDNNYIAYREYEDKQGNIFSYWEEDFPDMISFEEGSYREIMRKDELPYYSLGEASTITAMEAPDYKLQEREYNGLFSDTGAGYEAYNPEGGPYFVKELVDYGTLTTNMIDANARNDSEVLINSELPEPQAERGLTENILEMADGDETDWFLIPQTGDVPSVARADYGYGNLNAVCIALDKGVSMNWNTFPTNTTFQQFFNHFKSLNKIVDKREQDIVDYQFSQENFDVVSDYTHHDITFDNPLRAVWYRDEDWESLDSEWRSKPRFFRTGNFYYDYFPKKGADEVNYPNGEEIRYRNYDLWKEAKIKRTGNNFTLTTNTAHKSIATWNRVIESPAYSDDDISIIVIGDYTTSDGTTWQGMKVNWKHPEEYGITQVTDVRAIFAIGRYNYDLKVRNAFIPWKFTSQVGNRVIKNLSPYISFKIKGDASNYNLETYTQRFTPVPNAYFYLNSYTTTFGLEDAVVEDINARRIGFGNYSYVYDYINIPLVFTNFTPYKLSYTSWSGTNFEDMNIAVSGDTLRADYQEFKENPNGYKYASVVGKAQRFFIYELREDTVREGAGVVDFAEEITHLFHKEETYSFPKYDAENFLDNPERRIAGYSYDIYMRTSDYTYYQEIEAIDDLGYAYHKTIDEGKHVYFNGNKLTFEGLDNVPDNTYFVHRLQVAMMPDPLSVIDMEIHHYKNYPLDMYLGIPLPSGTGSMYWVVDYQGDHRQQFVESDKGVAWFIDGMAPHVYTSGSTTLYYPELGMTPGTGTQPKIQDYTYTIYMPASNVPSGNAYVFERKVMSYDDFRDYTEDFTDSAFLGYNGDWSLTRINLDSIKYGFSYKTDIITDAPHLVYLDGWDVIKMLNQWKSNPLWKPERYWIDLGDDKAFEVVETKTQPYEWHVMGVATDKPIIVKEDDTTYKHVIQKNETLLQIINDTVGGWYDHYGMPDYTGRTSFSNAWRMPVYVEFTTKRPANTFEMTEYDLYPTMFKGRDLDDDNFLNLVSYGNYNVFIRDVEKGPSLQYKTITEFETGQKSWYRYTTGETYYYLNYMLIDEIVRVMKNTLVPMFHWPEMLFTDEHYEDITLYEYPKGGPQAPYPELGYYAPKREFFDDPIIVPSPHGVDKYAYYNRSDIPNYELPHGFVRYMDTFMDYLYNGQTARAQEVIDNIDFTITNHVELMKSYMTQIKNTFGNQYFTSVYKRYRSQHSIFFPLLEMNVVWSHNIMIPLDTLGLMDIYREIDNPEYDVKWYRHVADTHTYVSTEKAGEIYVARGVNPATALHLSNIEDVKAPVYFDTNCFSFDYAGQAIRKSAGRIIDKKISNEDFTAYPKDGIAQDGYWYKYLGTNEIFDFVWPEYDLRSVPVYNIDINTSQDLSIGDVAGASFSVQVQGTVKELIKYLGRKCKLRYDFKNQGIYTSFGTFTIDDISFINHSVSQIVAYDNIKKFDKPVLDYMTTLTYPMTAKKLWHIMCDYCEVPYYQQEEFLNSDALIHGPFGDNNLTARTVVGYIAQIAGGFIKCDDNGYAVIRNLMPVRTSLRIGEEDYHDDLYITDYKNLPPFITVNSERDGAKTYNTVYLKGTQKTQRMNEFPIDLMDTINYNSVSGINFITFRNEINSILDLSDNPFVFSNDSSIIAKRIMDRIIDQFWLVYPVDRKIVGPNLEGQEVDSHPYNGDIKTFEFNLEDLGIASMVELTNNRQFRFIIPTTISIDASGVSIIAKGQSTYSQKVIGNQLSRQVDVIRNVVNETRLLIPDALTTTLNEMNEDIDNLESWQTSTNSAIETINTTNTTQNQRLTTVENKVVDDNSIVKRNNNVYVESGGQTMTFAADADGYLTISFGGLSWKLKLETEDN